MQRHSYARASDPELGDEEARLRLAPAGSPARALLTLFSSQHHLARPDAAALFGEETLHEFIVLGLLRVDADALFGDYRISAADSLFIVHDPGPPTRPDYVGGVNPAARTLASLTMRRPVATALDLCTGSGYQAMLLARHASHVVATDLLPRAVWLGRLNAELNEIENVEFREGNLSAPVAGERFDLIACNPPFIISPDMAYAFRDGGGKSDSLSETVVRGISRQLTDGGVAAMLVNWGLRANEDWAAPAREWLAGSGCDAVLLRYGSADPVAYAALWNAHLAHAAPEGYRDALDRWPAYLAELNFERVVHAGVVLRKREGNNPVAPFDAAGPEGDATSQLERMLAAATGAMPAGETILDVRLRLIEGHRLEQRMTFEDGSYRIDPATVVLKEHAGVAGTVPANLVPFILGLGSGTAREAAGNAAEQLGLEPRAYLDEASALVRELLVRGLIELAAA